LALSNEKNFKVEWKIDFKDVVLSIKSK